MIQVVQSALNPDIDTRGLKLVKCLDLEEDKPLPDELSVGSKKYNSFKTN